MILLAVKKLPEKISRQWLESKSQLTPQPSSVTIFHYLTTFPHNQESVMIPMGPQPTINGDLVTVVIGERATAKFSFHVGMNSMVNMLGRFNQGLEGVSGTTWHDEITPHVPEEPLLCTVGTEVGLVRDTELVDLTEVVGKVAVAVGEEATTSMQEVGWLVVGDVLIMTTDNLKKNLNTNLNIEKSKNC
ncbi:hypothetical protein HN011_000956 [Eciton burchellii]|nr:hypothetical protein HN011_000956 [Eciton burchellii]